MARDSLQNRSRSSVTPIRLPSDHYRLARFIDPDARAAGDALRRARALAADVYRRLHRPLYEAQALESAGTSARRANATCAAEPLDGRSRAPHCGRPRKCSDRRTPIDTNQDGREARWINLRPVSYT